MNPKANASDHRPVGSRVEYGMGGKHGPDKLGWVIMEQRQYGEDGYLIQPLNPGPGEGTYPSVWPARMVQDWQPIRWRAEGGRWRRTYLELEYRSERAALAVAQREGAAMGLAGRVVERDGWWHIETPARQQPGGPATTEGR